MFFNRLYSILIGKAHWLIDEYLKNQDIVEHSI